MSTSTQTIRETIPQHTADEPAYWFDQDLTIDELRRTVAVINAAMRSPQRSN